MATNKKKIEKRWKITCWDYDASTREVIAVRAARTKPLTERRARSLAREDLAGHSCCWMIEVLK